VAHWLETGDGTLNQLEVRFLGDPGRNNGIYCPV